MGENIAQGKCQAIADSSKKIFVNSSEASSNSPLNSDYSPSLSGGGALSGAEHSQPVEPTSQHVSDDARSTPPRGQPPHRSRGAIDRAKSRQPAHRIAQVRESQGVSLRTISRRSGIPVRTLRQQERPHTDLRLSELKVWAEALEVPVGELLSEPGDSLCGTVAQRAQMVRLMKTVEAMRAHAKAGSMRQISDAMRQQLLEIMPELEDVTAWPKEGSRRPAGGIGKIGTQPIPTARIESPSQADGA